MLATSLHSTNCDDDPIHNWLRGHLPFHKLEQGMHNFIHHRRIGFLCCYHIRPCCNHCRCLQAAAICQIWCSSHSLTCYCVWPHHLYFSQWSWVPEQLPTSRPWGQVHTCPLPLTWVPWPGPQDCAGCFPYKSAAHVGSMLNRKNLLLAKINSCSAWFIECKHCETKLRRTIFNSEKVFRVELCTDLFYAIILEQKWGKPGNEASFAGGRWPSWNWARLQRVLAGVFGIFFWKPQVAKSLLFRVLTCIIACFNKSIM